MTNGADWHDPFADDPDAVERERRRAEREARRRDRQQSLGEKVQESGAEQATPPTPPTAEAPPPATPAPAAPAAPPPAEAPVEPPPALGPRRPPGGQGRSPTAMRNRRIIGAIVFLALLALLAFGVVKVIGKLGGDDPAPVKTPPAKVQELTIPEGYDRHQIAQLAKEAGLKGDYEQASKSFKGFDPAKYGAEDPPNLEGFLFPATYELPKKGTVKDLISRQLDQGFKPNIKGVDMSYAESKNLNVYDVLKIASMIEREVAVAKERPLVAEVIYNRLKAGTPLGIDATLRYYLQNYDEQLTESELNQQEPYNTRINPGLPPTPIGNPGLDSIEAAANPAKGDLFYFVVKPGTCNEHVFVETDAEFQQAEAEYQQALQEQGGSPTDC
jgi:hypothetical protein